MNRKLTRIIIALMAMAATAASADCPPGMKASTTHSTETTVTDSFFCRGMGVLQGRFTGKRPEIIVYYGYNGVTGESKPKNYNVADDGSFCISFDLDYPIFDYAVLGDKTLYFYASPGDTADVTIDSAGIVRYAATTRHRKLLEMMSNDGIRLKINHKTLRAMAQQSTFAEFTAWAETQVDSLKRMADSIAERHALTAEEHKLLTVYTMMDACTDCYDYRYINGFAIDTNADDYHFMRNLPADIPSCLACTSRLYFLINRYKHHGPISFMDNPASPGKFIPATDSAAIAADEAVFGAGSPSVFLQLTWTGAKDNRMAYQESREEAIKDMARRMELATLPYLRDVLNEQITMLQQPVASLYELPDGPGTDVFRALTAKYRGKYVLVNFWSTSCSPCRMEIESSSILRDSIATLPDVELVFITNEAESPKETYDKYAKDNLQGEVTLRIPNTDYRRLMSLFEFNGIPHNELVAPDGRIINADFDLRAFKNFSSFNKFMDNIKATSGISPTSRRQ